jgi:hypothetical protein
VQIRLVALMLAVASCAGGDDGDAGTASDAEAADAEIDATPTPTCVVTLAGGLEGTIPCAATAGKRDSEGFTILAGLTSAASGSIASVVFSIRLANEIEVRGYEPTDMILAAVSVMATDARTYAASRGMGEDRGTVGSLSITSLELVAGDDPSLKIWTPHGTFSATLAGVSAGDTTTMTVAF